MNHKIPTTVLTLIIAVGLIVGIAPLAYAGGPCSLARAAAEGNWSFTDNGTVIGVGPRTAVGVFTLDGNGNLLNGKATSSLDGVVESETFSGTYTANPDCTGSFDVKIYSGGSELFEVTIFASFDDNLKQVRGVFTSVVTPNGTALPTVINLEGRKQ
jgi:hypothetical protein